MTRGAQAFRDREVKKKEIATNKEIADKQLADKQKEREWKTQENRKDRFIKGASILASQFKLPNRLSILNNDPVLYKQFIQQLDRFFNVSTYHRLGVEPWDNLKLICNGPSNLPLKLPGIMVIKYIPTNGPQPDNESSSMYPCNQALNRDKEQILKLNSRSSVNYEGVDIGLNILCTADIITAITEVRRILVIYQTYKGDNAYLAEQYIRALEVDYDDLNDNIADYRKQYVKIVNWFNSSVVAPADASIYARKLYLANNVFADREGSVKQAYMYRCVHFHRLNAAGDGTAISTFYTGLKLSGYFTYLKLAIESITANPDYVEMYADMRHAFTNLLQLNAVIDANEEIKFNIDPLNRAQIHNIRTLPYIGGSSATRFDTDASNWTYKTDSNGYLVQGPANGKRYVNITTSLSAAQNANLVFWLQFVYGKNSDCRCAMLFDMDKDIIDGDDILDITRSNIFCSNIGIDGGAIKMTVDQCGTELFTEMVNHQLYNGTFYHQYITTEYIECNDSGNPPRLKAWDSCYTKFDWAPIRTIYSLNQGSVVAPTGSIIHYFNMSDLDHPFIIDFKTIAQLNEACTLSLFYITASGFKA